MQTQLKEKIEVPIFILTKASELIRRDIPLLQKINERAFVRVGFTITLADPETKQIFEPSSPSTESRFRMMNELNDLGIESGGCFFPIIPFIGDTMENMESIVKSASTSAKFLLHGSMSLKPGHKELFLRTIAQFYPEFLSRYDSMYQRSFWPNPQVYNYPDQQVHELCKQYNVPQWIPRYVPEGRIADNLLGAAHLWAISAMYRWQGKIRRSKTFEDAGYQVDSLKQPWSTNSGLSLSTDVVKALQAFRETGTSPVYQSLWD